MPIRGVIGDASAEESKRVDSALASLEKSEAMGRYNDLRAAYPELDGTNTVENVKRYLERERERAVADKKAIEDDPRLAYRPQGRQGPVEGGHWKRTKLPNEGSVPSPSKEPSDSHGFFRYKYEPESDSIVVEGSSAGVRLGARVSYEGAMWTVVGSDKLTVYLEPYTAPTASNAVPGVHRVVMGKDGSRRPWIDAVGNLYPEGAMSPIRIRVPRADILGAIPWVEKPMRVRGSAHGTRTGTVAGRPVYGNAVDAFAAFIDYVVNLRHSTETFSRCARCGGDYCPSMRGRFQQRADGRWELSRWGRCPATFDGPTKAAEKHSRRCVATRTAEVLRGTAKGRHSVDADPSKVRRSF